jgi:hypothetical protein
MKSEFKIVKQGEKYILKEKLPRRLGRERSSWVTISLFYNLADAEEALLEFQSR